MRVLRATKGLGLVSAILALSACGGGGGFRAVSDVPVRVGPAYTVRGSTYVPAADPAYDSVGYATWYGPESGNRTANGERFEADWVTAAHKTLPLPTYVEVTALDSGKRIIVRVNDRGPFGNSSRIIDLSRGAADQLGIRRQGVAPVRVRVIEPSARDRERLRKGKPAKDLSPVSERELRKLRERLPPGG